MRGPDLPPQRRLLEAGLGAVDARVADDEFFARDPAARCFPLTQSIHREERL